MLLTFSSWYFAKSKLHTSPYSFVFVFEFIMMKVAVKYYGFLGDRKRWLVCVVQTKSRICSVTFIVLQRIGCGACSFVDPLMFACTTFLVQWASPLGSHRVGHLNVYGICMWCHFNHIMRNIIRKISIQTIYTYLKNIV